MQWQSASSLAQTPWTTNGQKLRRQTATFSPRRRECHRLVWPGIYGLLGTTYLPVVCPVPAARAAATTRQQHAHQILIAKPPKSFKPQSPFPLDSTQKGLGASPCGLPPKRCCWFCVTCLMYAFGFAHEDVAMTLNIDENKSNFRQPGIRCIR